MGVEGSGRKGKKESGVHDVVYTSRKNKKLMQLSNV